MKSDCQAVVQLVGLKADAGGPGSLGRLGGDQVVARRDPVDRGSVERDLVGVLQVPGDALGARVQTGPGQAFADVHDEADALGWCGVRAGLRRPSAGRESGLTLEAVAGHQLGDPTLGDAVIPRDGGLGLTEQNSSDHKALGAHALERHRSLPCHATTHADVLRQHTVPATSRLDPVPEGIGSFLYAGMNGAGIHPRSTS